MSNQITITRGDERTWTSLVTHADDKPLVGSTIRAMFRRSYTGAVVITKTTADGSIAITSDVSGNRAISMKFVAADTSALSVRGEVLYYDLELTFGDGSGPFTTESGVLGVMPESSHD